MADQAPSSETGTPPVHTATAAAASPDPSPAPGLGRATAAQIFDAVRSGDLTAFNTPTSDGTADETDLVTPHGPTASEPAYIGHYRILERIDEGGMGTVYRAEQREPVRRVVALKVIKPGMDTREVVARFEAERQALALMSHPNVAQVFEAGATARGRPFFAMEYVPGVPLTRYCDDQRQSICERLELFLPVCQAVQHAHQKGIIHRDLKPSNILVMLVDGKPVPKVIDFGIAKATTQALTPHTLCTRTGTLIGTPDYMSPEQAITSGLDVDTRADVYSLGVILYELLTGALPFDLKTLHRSGPQEIARVIRDTEPSKPSTRLKELSATANRTASAGGVPTPDSGITLIEAAKRRRSEPKALLRQVRGDLDVVVLKAIEKDRTRRYETAAALATDVRRYLDDEPVLARPPSAGYLLRRRLRRHRRPLTIAGALLLLVGVLVVVFGIRIHRDENAAWVLTTRWDRAYTDVPGDVTYAVHVPPRARVAVTVDPAPPTDASINARVRTPEEHAQRAKELLRSGDYAAAASQFEEALKTEPSNVDVLQGLALCEIETGNRQKGLERLEKALTLSDPPPRGLVHNAAVAYLPVNPLRSAELVRNYLSRPDAPVDEALHDLMGAALTSIDARGRLTQARTDAEAFYFAYKQRLEQAAGDGRKRWGSEWVPGAVADSKWETFKSRRADVDRLQTEAAAAERNRSVAVETLAAARSAAATPPEQLQAAQKQLASATAREADLQRQLRAAELGFVAVEKPPLPPAITFLPFDQATGTDEQQRQSIQDRLRTDQEQRQRAAQERQRVAQDRLKGAQTLLREGSPEKALQLLEDLEMPEAAMLRTEIRQLADSAKDTARSADQAFKDARYAQAFDLYTRAAQGGNAWSMFRLGCMLRDGLGRQKNPREAMVWFQRAADRRNTSAMRAIAIAHWNRDAAMEWVKPIAAAADAGDIEAMVNIADMHERGEVVARSDATAAKYYLRAAKLGDVAAMVRIASFYEGGRGIEKDLNQARAWYKQAAKQGSPDAKAWVEANQPGGQ